MLGVAEASEKQAKIISYFVVHGAVVNGVVAVAVGGGSIQ